MGVDRQEWVKCIDAACEKVAKMRTCGECVACCVYPRIDDRELQKAAMTHCPHLTLPREPEKGRVFYTGGNGSQNCTANADKPRGCAAYACAWLSGYGDEDDRPDKSLMLFDNSRGITNAIEGKPLADGVESTPEGRAVANRMSASTGRPVIVVNFYERRIQRIVGRSVE